jgi:hypothetical protein
MTKLRGHGLTGDVRELDVAALSPFLNRKALNVDVPGMFSGPIRINYADAGGLAILVIQC